MPETDPAITPTCSHCGSDSLIPDAFLFAPNVGTDLKMQVGVYRKPDAKVMKSPVKVETRVSVCGDCGHVRIAANEPGTLWDAYVDRLARTLDR